MDTLKFKSLYRNVGFSLFEHCFCLQHKCAIASVVRRDDGKNNRQRSLPYYLRLCSLRCMKHDGRQQRRDNDGDFLLRSTWSWYLCELSDQYEIAEEKAYPSIYIRYASQFSHFSIVRFPDHPKQRIQSKQYVIKLSLTLYLDVMQHTVMNDHVSSSVFAYTQQHRQYLNRRKAKRRALLEERRVLLDTVYSNRPIHSLSIALKTVDAQSQFLLGDEARSDPLDGTSTDQQRFDESISSSYDRSASDNVLCEDDATHPSKNHLQLNQQDKSNDDLGSVVGCFADGLDGGFDDGLDAGLDGGFDDGLADALGWSRRWSRRCSRRWPPRWSRRCSRRWSRRWFRRWSHRCSRRWSRRWFHRWRFKWIFPSSFMLQSVQCPSTWFHWRQSGWFL